MLNRITPAQAAHNMEDKDFCDRVLWVPAGAQYVYNDCAAESDSTTIGTAKTTPPAVPSSTWGRFQVPDTYYDISLEQMQPWSDEP